MTDAEREQIIALCRHWHWGEGSGGPTAALAELVLEILGEDPPPDDVRQPYNPDNHPSWKKHRGD